MSQVLCPVLAKNHNNIITKDNIGSLLLSNYARVPGTRVTVSCYVPTSFSLNGPSQVVCGTSGQWSPSVPSCVRRSSSNNNNNGNTSETTEDNNVSSTDTDDSSILSDYSIIVIAVAAAFVAVLIIILIIFLCKHFSSRSKDDDGMKEPINVQYIEPPLRPHVAIVKVDNMFSSPLQDVYTGPSSPPSWHSHPIIVMADEYKHRTWSQLSVDQYLREMDTSRRENPNHSWRDFATLSSYYSRSFSSIV